MRFRNLLVQGLKLLGGELLADLKEHVGVLFLEIAASLRDPVDGGKDLALVLKIGMREGGEAVLLLLILGVKIQQSRFVGFEDCVHTSLLIRRDF